MISIIIPSYGQKDYLAEAIESALGQTKKAEIIVIDDGSKDGSLEVAKSFRGIKVISQVNKGLASARNTGIMNATGDYILPLDADDILLDNCVEVIEAAIEKTGADIVAPSFRTFGVSVGEVIMQDVPSLEDFKTGNRLPYFSAIRKSALLEVGGYNPKMTWGWEDFDIWFDLLKRRKTLCVLKNILVLYRTKENSMIHEADKHKNELMTQIYNNHRELWPY